MNIVNLQKHQQQYKEVLMIQTSNFEAVYPFLSSPDTHFKTEGEYVKLKVKKSDAQEDIKKSRKLFQRVVKNTKRNLVIPTAKGAPLPYKEEGDFVIFHFKMKTSGINGKTKPYTQKPKLVDHALNPIGEDKFIYGGSIMRVNYKPVGYNVASVGLVAH